MERSQSEAISTDVERYDKFLLEFDLQEKIESRLLCCLNWMREMLSSPSLPNGALFPMRLFWNVKERALSLFKEKSIPSAVRSELWVEYTQLSDQMRQLREVLDEKASFVVEQIELAIGSIEKRIDNWEGELATIPEILLPEGCPILEKNGEQYLCLQRESDLIKILLSGLAGLRSELGRTQMRMRYKYKLLDRIQILTGKLLPKRKELVELACRLFTVDVDLFIEKTLFPEGIPRFRLKEEIKGLQAVAKMLPLSPAVFGTLRGKLSNCWESIREKELQLQKRPKKREKVDEPKRENPLLDSKTEVDRFLEKIAQLLNGADLDSTDALVEKWELLVKQEKGLAISEAGRAVVCHQLGLVVDAIQEKKWKELFLGESTERDPLAYLLLEERIGVKEQIKNSLEEKRKYVGRTGLSVQDGLLYQEIMKQERARLGRVENMIEEMEQKLFDAEG